MANEEQLSILKQGVKVWNEWRQENFLTVKVDLARVDLKGVDLREAHLFATDFSGAKLRGAIFSGAELSLTNFRDADLRGAHLIGANLFNANLIDADLSWTNLGNADLRKTELSGTNFLKAKLSATIFGSSDLSTAIGLENVLHQGPCDISTNALARSKGKIPEPFLRGCGLSDADIEYAKLSNLDLSNEEINKILYRIYDIRATQAIQIFPLFISYNHTDNEFVDKIGNKLTEKGIRYWRDIHEMKAGRIERQIDRAISQNRTVLLVLSEHSLASDWVEHEVRTARELEKEVGRDVLCPVALDDSWKNSPWPKRVMEQIMEYNILDFSAWRDDSNFEGMFRKLIDGLELFYKG